MAVGNSKLTGIIVIALVAIGGGAVLWWALQPAKTPLKSDSSLAPSTSQQAPSEQHGQADTVVITYTDRGFTPTDPMIKRGGTVTVRNTSSHDVQFSSDPHPAHTGEGELNLKELAPGEAASFTVTRVGNFGFHNHLNPSESGTLMVME